MEEEKMPDMNELKMKIFEMENPAGAKKLEMRVKKKMEKTQIEIIKMVEKEIDKFIEKKNLEKPSRSYIG